MFKRSFLYLVILSNLLFAGCIITGRVVDENGNGIEGVTVTLTGAANLTTTTGSNGGYIFGNFFDVILLATNSPLSLIIVGDYTITPSKSGYSFTPSSSDVSVTEKCYGPLALDLPWLVGGVDFEANCTQIGFTYNDTVGKTFNIVDTEYPCESFEIEFISNTQLIVDRSEIFSYFLIDGEIFLDGPAFDGFVKSPISTISDGITC